MKLSRIFVPLAALSLALSAWSQTPPPGESTGTTNQPEELAPGATNEWGTSNLSFTNKAGQVFSVDQLAGQLQNLRRDIDQTLPTLSAFTEAYSNTVTGGQSSLGNAISGILSSVLNRNTNAAGTSAQGSPQSTNLLYSLQQLLTTNAPAGASANPTRYEDLLALQERLQTLPSLFQKLNVSGTTNQFTTPGLLSPTGR